MVLGLVVPQQLFKPIAHGIFAALLCFIEFLFARFKYFVEVFYRGFHSSLGIHDGIEVVGF
jgi:hypothetical protein